MQKGIIYFIIKKYFQEQPSRAVENKFRKWFLSDHSALEKEEALHSVWENLEVEPDENTWHDLEMIHQRIKVIPTMKHRAIRPVSWVIGIAAACIIILLSAGLTYYFTEKQSFPLNSTQARADAIVEYLSPVDDTKQVKLPDGTKALLNRGSILIYNDHYNHRTRTVYLVGQANFKVTKNPHKPFIVKASGVSVTALGTEFDVKAYPNQPNVTATLLHGKVKVNCVAGSKTNTYLLDPNQRVVYRKDSMQSCKEDVDVKYVSSWSKKRIIFKEVAISEIFQALEHYDNISIAYNKNDLNNDKYNVTFRRTQSVGQKLRILRKLSGDSFDFQQNGDKIRILTY